MARHGKFDLTDSNDIDMIIPPEKLEPQTLLNILKEYILREGTDYGEHELSMDDKIERLMPQVRSGKVLVVYDEASESIDIREADSYQEP